MSALSSILKGGTIVVLSFAVGLTINQRNVVKHQAEVNQSQIRQVKAQYQTELTKHPSVKSVSTSYQKALNLSKIFLHEQNRLHDQKSLTSTVAKDALNRINNMVENPGQLNNPLVVNQIKGWYGEISYGGEDVNGRVSMAYRFYNAKHELMNLTVFTYNPASNKLSQFISFPTYAGQKVLQESLRG